MKKQQMYVAGMTCDKVTENTVAFQVSTIKPEIAPQYSANSEMWERLQIPMRVNPKGLFVMERPYVENFCHTHHIESMCEALLPEDHYFSTKDLSDKLLRVMTTGHVLNDLRLVGVTILDGRLHFRLWEPAGLQTIKVLPTELRGTDCFDFGLQESPHARDGVRIACMWLDGKSFQFIVEHYHRGRRNEVLMAKNIIYRPIHSDTEEIPHFKGYMETLTVQ